MIMHGRTTQGRDSVYICVKFGKIKPRAVMGRVSLVTDGDQS